MSDFLKTLKVGDKVGIKSSGLGFRSHITTAFVERITPSGRIVVYRNGVNIVFDKNGVQYGPRAKWELPLVLIELTPEVVAAQYVIKARNHLKSFDFDKLSDENIKTVYELLKTLEIKE